MTWSTWSLPASMVDNGLQIHFRDCQRDHTATPQSMQSNPMVTKHLRQFLNVSGHMALCWWGFQRSYGYLSGGHCRIKPVTFNYYGHIFRTQAFLAYDSVNLESLCWWLLSNECASKCFFPLSDLALYCKLSTLTTPKSWNVQTPGITAKERKRILLDKD